MSSARGVPFLLISLVTACAADMELETTAAIDAPLRVMTFNIQTGGITFGGPGNMIPQFDRKDRLIDEINAMAPELLAVQEACLVRRDGCGWVNIIGDGPGFNRPGDPRFERFRELVDELGMQGMIANTPSPFPLAIFSEHEILEVRGTIPGEIEFRRPNGEAGPGPAIGAPIRGIDRAAYARIQRPDGELHVYNVHPYSDYSKRNDTRPEELRALLADASQHLDDDTLIMGDFNVNCLSMPECPERELMREAGWTLIEPGTWQIDEVWASPSLAAWHRKEPDLYGACSFADWSSDHLSVVVDISTRPPFADSDQLDPADAVALEGWEYGAVEWDPECCSHLELPVVLPWCE